MADEPKVVELEHPDLGAESRQVFREDEGFWNDKLAQIDVLKAQGFKEVRPKPAASSGGGGDSK